MPVSAAAIDALKQQIGGEVVLPSAPEYEIHRRVFNPAVNRRPALIVRCAGGADVIAALGFARTQRLPFSTKGGGHGPTGFAVCDDGVVIDLAPMRGVVVDGQNRRAVVQAGALWRDVYREAAAVGLVASGGTCDMVGVAGHTLGGGWGYLSRSFGLASDNLERVHLVTADGNVLAASETEHPDLFWALRGGGGGNFGIVTAFEYRLHPLGPVFGGSLTWPFKSARKVLAKYRDLVGGFPDHLYVDVTLYGSPEGDKAVSIGVVSLGPLHEARKALEPFGKVDPSVIQRDLGPRTFASVLKSYADSIVYGRLQAWRGAFLKPRITDQTIDAIVDRFARPPSLASLFFIEPLGGAIRRVSRDATAYVHRDQSLCATVIGIWTDASQTADMERWTRDFAGALRPAYSGASYINYPDVELADWPKAYYGANYARLVDVKRKYDPKDVFHFAQSIGAKP